jgi:hypothetical protein
MEMPPDMLLKDTFSKLPASSNSSSNNSRRRSSMPISSPPLTATLMFTLHLLPTSLDPTLPVTTRIADLRTNFPTKT